MRQWPGVYLGELIHGPLYKDCFLLIKFRLDIVQKQ